MQRLAHTSLICTMKAFMDAGGFWLNQSTKNLAQVEEIRSDLLTPPLSMASSL